MKIEPFFLLILLILIPVGVSAQEESEIPYFQKLYTSKNRVLYGGAISLQSPVTSMKVLQIGIQPQFGGFVANNFAVLGIVHGSYGTDGKPSHYLWNIGGGVELRYYVFNSSCKLFIYGNAVPHYIYYYQGDFGIMAGGGPGVAFFTGPKFSINIGLYAGIYRNASYYSNSPVFSFTIGMNGLFSTLKNKDVNDPVREEDF